MNKVPTIMATSESTHYLVGATDGSNNFIALPELAEVAVCNSLSSAKDLLRDYKFATAELRVQTAYDEMCGLPESVPSIQTLYL